MCQRDPKQIGQRIRQTREQLGYTREEFAERIGVTPKFCADLELGVKGMSVRTLCRIADTLMVSTDYILNGEMQQGQASHIYTMLSHCEADKIQYAEDLLKIFLQAVD